jgi:hypothetical protein
MNDLCGIDINRGHSFALIALIKFYLKYSYILIKIFKLKIIKNLIYSEKIFCDYDEERRLKP